MAEQQQDHWHVKKELTWGHIVTTAGLVIAGALAFGDIDNRITVVEVTQKYQEVEQTRTTEAQNQRIDASQKSLEKQIDSLGSSLEKIGKKIDKLIDRELNGNGKH